MIYNPMEPVITLNNGNSTFSFLERGDAYKWICGSVMINAFCGNPLDGSSNNIYLRIYHDGALSWYPLTGRSSESSLKAGSDYLLWEGRAEEISYTVTFRLTPFGIWFWDIALEGACPKADVVYSQDIGLASPGSLNTNELYTAQYLGHSVFETADGYTVCSRQNMSQDGAFPYLRQGSLSIRTVAYSTDATQFFGLSYKKTNEPEALSRPLESVNKQFELSHTALQTETFPLSGTKTFSFYGICRTDHPDVITAPEYDEDLLAAFACPCSADSFTYPVTRLLCGAPYASPEWDSALLESFYPKRELEEQNDGTLYSFFTPDNSHVVLQAKELVTERPHGHILMSSFDCAKVPENVVSSTNYMYGIFHSQFVAGNTNMNKLLSNHRGLLNAEKQSGQRLYVKTGSVYRMLTLPAAYEMNLAGSTWYYTLGKDILIVEAYSVYGRPEMALHVRSLNEQSYDFIVASQLTAGPDEQTLPVHIEETENILTVTPDKACITYGAYPNLQFRMLLPKGSRVSDDRVFFADNAPRNTTLMCISLSSETDFTLVMQGSESGQQQPFLSQYEYLPQKEAFRKHYGAFLSGFHLDSERPLPVCAQKLNTILPWYAHDALIHFASPHGLEQSGGAAWGTRDVCQGPMEFFLTTGHYALARDILIRLFSHQLSESGEWPQWFMFDRYCMHQEDCHGDVVFWPLKALADYLTASGDFSVLEEVMDYRFGKTAFPAGQSEPLSAHVKRAFRAIKTRFLKGTYLISYAGGDWDDTLQPADKTLKDRLVSAWTQALAASTLSLLGTALAENDSAFSSELMASAQKIATDFRDYLIKDDVIAGFLYRNPDGACNLMLHPDDKETSIQYRLLPLTRSIIAHLVSPEIAARSISCIDTHLSCPDGVRLMNHPAGYEGGNSKIFLRAEQAANVGREISLQYVHAHIRYLEAMSVYGSPSRAWHGLMCINPVLLSDCVANALPRQSNVYFSSSEGCYNDRYEYAEHFYLLRKGEIPVKGGWRLYSSGPGIYIRRVIADLLGIRFTSDSIIIDPVITEELNGVALTYHCFGTPVTFRYQTNTHSVGETTVFINGKEWGSTRFNPYRKGGVELSKTDFLDAVQAGGEVCITTGTAERT